MIRLAGGNKYIEGAGSELRRYYFSEVVTTKELAILLSSSNEGFATFLEGTSDLDNIESNSVGLENSSNDESI